MVQVYAVINAGSSSIKFSLFEENLGALTLTDRGQIEGLYVNTHFVSKNAEGAIQDEKRWPAKQALNHESALDFLISYLKNELTDKELVAIGHRVVHGGVAYKKPILANAEVISDLEVLIPLAPLHQPHNLAPISRILRQAPDIPQVICFDTSFHTSQPNLAQMFALPAELRDAGILRYGFHGLSFEYIARVLPEVSQKAATGKCVVLHLGNGASMCAMESGKSMAVTTGFTAVEGLPMGTRSGTIDPGVVLYLIDQKGFSVRDVELLLYKKSGLLGISGISSDMRELLSSDVQEARLAIDYYTYRIRRELGSLTAALGGLDAIVFTAGIGENSHLIRSRVVQDAAWLGVKIDEQANRAGKRCISAPSSRVDVYVIPTNEEWMIAHHTRRVLNSITDTTHHIN